MYPGDDNLGCWTHYSRSPLWSRKAFFLPHSQSEAQLSNPRLGRLDTDVHYSRTDEDFDLPLPTPYRRLEEGRPKHVRSHSFRDAFHTGVDISLLGSLQTVEKLLGRGCGRCLSFKSSGGIHRPGPGK